MEEADETPAPAASRRRCRPKFDVLSPYGPGFSEGNTWNYILALPHVPAGLTAKKKTYPSRCQGTHCNGIREKQPALYLLKPTPLFPILNSW